MRYLVGLIILTIMAFGVDASAQLSISPQVSVTSQADANSPCVHVDRDGNVLVSWFGGDSTVRFARSLDGGQTFAPPVTVARIPRPSTFATSLQRAPNFAIDTKGTIHMLFNKTTPGTWQADLWYVRSIDHGVTWTAPVSIMDPDDSENYNKPFYSTDFPVIGCDSSDNVYVAYLDNRYLERGIIDHYQLQVEKSTDGGDHWSLPIIANKLPVENGGTCECCRQDIAVSPEGHLYIAFRTDMNVSTSLDDRSIFICRSMDRGATWDSSIRCQLGTWNLDACPTKGPVISLDKKENLFLAWCDARDDTGRLVSYTSRLQSGESTISSNTSISTRSQRGVWPYMAISPSGLQAYAYLTQQGTGAMQFTYSSDDGKTWLRHQNVSGIVADNTSGPSLAFDGDDVCYMVWQDSKAGIKCSAVRGFTIGQASVDNSTAANEISVFPNPSASKLTVRIPHLGDVRARITLTNSLGEIAMASSVTATDNTLTLDVQRLPAGSFTCTIEAPSGRWVAPIVIAR